MKIRKHRKKLAVISWVLIFTLVAVYAFALAPPRVFNSDMLKHYVIIEIKIDTTNIYDTGTTDKRECMKILKKLIEQSL